MDIWIPVIVAVISAIGSFCGVYYSNRKSAKESSDLINYRIGLLEEKVDRHNQVIDRTYHLEEQAAVLDQRIKALERKGA